MLRTLRTSFMRGVQDHLPQRKPIKNQRFDDGENDPKIGGSRAQEKGINYVPIREDVKIHPLLPSYKSPYGDHANLFKSEQATKYLDLVDPHKQIVQWAVERKSPIIAISAFVSPSATIIGRVELYEHTTVWPGTTINAQSHVIRIGAYTNIQDNCTISEEFGRLHEDHDGSTVIGNFVTVGHNAILRACTIEDECMVGSGSTLCAGSYMERRSMLAANSVLLANDRVPSGQVWAGNPANYIRDMTAEDIKSLQTNAEFYYKNGMAHKDEWYDEWPMPLYRQARKERIPVGFRLYPDPA